MLITLSIVSGIAWTIVYIEAIRLGLRQRTYAMPMAALGLNLGWEWTFGLHGLVSGITVQTVINLVWAVADVGILYTFFRFGRREFPQFVTRAMFAAYGVLILVIGFVVQWLFIVQFGWDQAPVFSAFLQNALMSGLFIAMFVSRRGARGQSLLLAVAKFLGTLAPTIAFGIIRSWDPFVLGVGIICAVLDVIYVGLLAWHRRASRLFDDRLLPAEDDAMRGTTRQLPARP